jgi:Zn-dependent peptidase ImmA (M78 family)
VTVIADALRGLKVGPEEIANRSRLPIERVQAITRGDVAALSEVRAIASGLRVPIHLLARPELASENPHIRPLFRDTKQGNVSYDITVERVAAFIEAALTILPERAALPQWLHLFKARERSYVEADRLAKQFRQLVYADHEAQPATDLIEVLGRLDGVVVARLAYSRYEGVSVVAGNYCFIFISPRFAGRTLFTAGHEVGHVVVHHDVDTPARFERPTDIGSFGRHSREESFVDAFASCVLLPDVGIGRSLQTFRDHFSISSKNLTDFELLLLARFYGVSFDVAARRCEELGLLPRGMGLSLAEHFRKVYRSPEKRADQLQVPARKPIAFPPLSKALADALSRKIHAGAVSIGWAADRLGLSIGEIIAAHSEAHDR